MTRYRKLPSTFYQEDFKSLAQNESNSKTKIRFMAFHHIQQGHTYTDTARIFLVTLDSVQKWISRYKKQGIEGLRNKKIPGRPSPNDAKDDIKIFDKIIAMQANKKGGRVRLNDIKEMLSKEFDIHYKGVNGVYYLVKKLGLSWISSRSKHPKQDIKAQSLYKKLQTKGNRGSAGGD